MAEYKLSYTAADIDKKLGKVDEHESSLGQLFEEIVDLKENGTGGGLTTVYEDEDGDICIETTTFENGDEVRY